MEFWGIEIKGDKPVKAKPEDGELIHLSQAVLVKHKKGNKPVRLSVKIDDQKLVLGILTDNVPQLSFDLLFEKEVDFSHDSKYGSIHLCGYKENDEEELYSDFSDDEDLLHGSKENGIPSLVSMPKPEAARKPKKAEKAKVEDNEGNGSDETDGDNETDDNDKDDSGNEDSLDARSGSEEHDDSDEDEVSDNDNDSDKDEVSDDDDDSDEDEVSDDEYEKLTKPAEAGKKRPAGFVKTPEAKKAKVISPQKTGCLLTDGKKGGHTDTPYPAKKAGKTPKSSDKSFKTPSKAKHSCGK